MNTTNDNAKKVYKIMIDNKPFDWEHRFIKGAEIRSLGNIPVGYQIFLKVNGPAEDELIEDEASVDLSQPGREHFYGCKPNTTNG
jgi:hypothetical protein